MKKNISIGSSTTQRTTNDGAQIISWSKAQLKKNQSELIALPGMCKWMCLYRKNVFWMEPAFGKNDTVDIPADTQILMWSAGGKKHIAIPLCHSDLRATISGIKDGIQIQWTGNEQKGAVCSSHADLLYVRSGSNIHTLCQDAMSELQKILGTFQLREDKVQADFIDYFTWCTWDAF
ncbi:MAG: hypothetical protein HRU15_06000, partial [Planctomycetes bacterium]|nr:hypothetical protein [Planctomycetota bacterium]